MDSKSSIMNYSRIPLDRIPSEQKAFFFFLVKHQYEFKAKFDSSEDTTLRLAVSHGLSDRTKTVGYLGSKSTQFVVSYLA